MRHKVDMKNRIPPKMTEEQVEVDEQRVEAVRVEERKAIGKYLAPIYDSTSTRLRHTIATLQRGERP